MADINLAPYTAEQQAIDRRRKMAEALQQQAVAPIEMPNMPGVRVSPLQGFAKLLQGYIAGKNLSRADKEQKDYENLASEDTARFLRNMGQFETVPGEVTTQGMPTQAPMINGAVDLREGADRALPIQRPTIDGAIDLGDEERFAFPVKPSAITGAVNLREGANPAEAISQAKSPARQIPLLNAGLLEPTNPLAFKTSQGRQLLAQYLMQQEAQKQAAAQAQLAAQQQIQSVAPGATLFQGGKAIYTNPKDSPPREIKTNDSTTGMPITKYVPENVLVTLGNIPDQYKGFAADLITANNLPAQITNNPQLLNLIGSQLNKQAGLVTKEDVANYMLKVAETRAKLGYEGIPFPEPTPLNAATNPLIQSKPLPPAGTQLEIGVVYDTPKGRGRWNGTSFTTVD
jgi:hypothetical protein